MDFLPWSTFRRIVARYGGDRRGRTLTCAEQYRAMAFAQLTAQSAKLYHMGFREPVRRSTLSDANEIRDWRIYAELAQRLIAQARRLDANENLGLDLSDTVYALDSTTIDLCLSLFPWAHFRATKAAVKMHTLLDLKAARLGRIALHFATDSLSHPLRENAHATGTFRNPNHMRQPLN
jgi:Domain of unknown function (DUF4372)